MTMPPMPVICPTFSDGPADTTVGASCSADCASAEDASRA
jgi:hypothetical protein